MTHRRTQPPDHTETQTHLYKKTVRMCFRLSDSKKKQENNKVLATAFNFTACQHCSRVETVGQKKSAIVRISFFPRDLKKKKGAYGKYLNYQTKTPPPPPRCARSSPLFISNLEPSPVTLYDQKMLWLVIETLGPFCKLKHLVKHLFGLCFIPKQLAWTLTKLLPILFFL